jgi:holo-[acyl-carrier protein] synthase
MRNPTGSTGTKDSQGYDVEIQRVAIMLVRMLFGAQTGSPERSAHSAGTESMNTGTSIRVGADVVKVVHVSDSIARFGERYLRRIYTEHEIASCAGSPSFTSAGLAARFAAKEAALKVLRPTGHRPDWRSIEVLRHPEGWCSMSLSGHAAELAAQAEISELAVSLTHEEDIAAAVVVALCNDPEVRAASQVLTESEVVREREMASTGAR